MHRVLYVITQGDNGGAQRYVLDMAKHFQGEIAVGNEGGFLKQAATKYNIPVHTIPHLQRAIQPYADICAIIELYKCIKQLKPDIVHVNSSKAGILGSVAGRLAGTAVVFTAHGFQYLEPMSWLKRFLYKSCERISNLFRTYVITVSEFDRRQALRDRVVRENNSKTIYHGIQPFAMMSRADARNALSIPLHAMVIGTIANTYYTKGLDIFLEAIACTQDASITYVIIGGGPQLSPLQKLAQKLGIEHQVVFTGQLPDARQYLKAFNIFILPSRKEGFPYVLLEALQAHLPIIATRVGGTTEAIGNAGILIEPDSSAALSQAILTLAKNSELQRVFTEQARVRSQEFSMESMLTETKKTYESILKKPHQENT